MKTSRAVMWLTSLIAGLAAVAAGAGLLWDGGGESFTFTTLRGESVEIFGRGVYRYDTLFAAAGAKGADAVVLFLGIPLLLLALWHYRRGSLRGGLLLLSTLGYFLYTYSSYALGSVTYNELFFVYVALFSASFYAFVLMFTMFDHEALAERFSPNMPRRGPAFFMLASGALTLIIWAGPIVGAQFAGQLPERLDSYTTFLTVALDLATITPATLLAAVLIFRDRPLGYLIAVSLLVLEAMLLPLIVVQTINQLAVGITYPIGQIVGPIMGFLLLAGLSIWVLASLLRHIVPTHDASVSHATLPEPLLTQR